MLTRRTFQLVLLALGAEAFSDDASGQQGGTVTVRIRADDSVRMAIPPIAQRNLAIEPDQSDEAKELARRAPAGRGLPVIFIILGAIAVTQLLQMIKELVRQTYYGGVVVDTRLQPPSVTNDPKIPANMIFVVEANGKTNQYTSDQFSLDVLIRGLKPK
jgi:hypothetical protein